MAKQKNAGTRTPEQDTPEGAQDRDRDRASRGKGTDASVVSNEEVELGDEDVEVSMDDDESDQITGRHPSQRDRDLR